MKVVHKLVQQHSETLLIVIVGLMDQAKDPGNPQEGEQGAICMQVQLT